MLLWKLQSPLPEAPSSLMRIRLAIVARAVELYTEALLRCVDPSDERALDLVSEALEQAAELRIVAVHELTRQEKEIVKCPLQRGPHWGVA